jgi:hypothetical protein
MLRSNLTSEAIDDVLTGSFPASDPPAWTPGVFRPAPETATPAGCTTGAGAAAVTDTARSAYSQRTHGQALASLAGAVAVMFLFPLAILVLGTPLALAVRGALEVARWLFAGTG